MLVVAARKLTSILLEEDCEINHSHILNNPVSVSLLSGDRKPQIRF